MGNLGVKGRRITRKTDKRSSQIQSRICISKGLKQPDTEESCGPSDKDPPTAELLPKRTRMLQHVLEVFLGEWRVGFVHKDKGEISETIIASQKP